MLKIDLQFFGGRGSSSGGSSSLPLAHPTGGAVNGNAPWGNAPNVQSPSTLRDALGNKGAPMSMAGGRVHLREQRLRWSVVKMPKKSRITLSPR